MAGIKGMNGRKGVPNKKSVEIADKLAALGCDPLQGMAEIAAIARREGDNALAGQMYKELAQYVAPKRKAIEHTGDLSHQITTIRRVIVNGTGD